MDVQLQHYYILVCLCSTPLQERNGFHSELLQLELPNLVDSGETESEKLKQVTARCVLLTVMTLPLMQKRRIWGFKIFLLLMHLSHTPPHIHTHMHINPPKPTCHYMHTHPHTQLETG